MRVEPGIKKESAVTKQKKVRKTLPLLPVALRGLCADIVKLCRNTRRDSVVAGGLCYMLTLVDLAKLSKDKHTQQI